MPRTIRRQPFTVSTSGSDYPQTNMFTHVDFKGICDSKNDITVESTTFADVKNIYLDDNGQLISRPPFKIITEAEDRTLDKYIIQEWNFGDLKIRSHRSLGTKDGNLCPYPWQCDMNELYFFIYLSAKVGEEDWKNITPLYSVSVASNGYDFVPKINITPIENKVFIWFHNTFLFVYDKTEDTCKDASEYLYIPIHKLVSNGIESDFESKNFLTDTYIRRYNYSAISSVNFSVLVDKEVSVRAYNDVLKDKSEQLYDITMQENQDKLLVYPYSYIGNQFFDFAQTPRSIVIIRHSASFKLIEVSFDGKYFRPLPVLENMIGEPILTKDGYTVIAFTTDGIAQCKLVADDTENSDFVMQWIIKPYKNSDGTTVDIDTNFVPKGYFETSYIFAYIFKDTSGKQYLCAEWLDGSNGTVHIVHDLYYNETGYKNHFPTDDIKLSLRYISDEAMIIAILAKKTEYTTTKENCLVTYQFADDGTFNKRSVNSLENNDSYLMLAMNNRAKDADLYIGIPYLDKRNILTCDITITCSATTKDNESGKANKLDYLIFAKCTIKTNSVSINHVKDVVRIWNENSKYFKIMSETKNFLTENYAYINGDINKLPNNGMLRKDITDERIVSNYNSLVLTTDTDEQVYEYNRNIHKLTDDFHLSSGIIKSGDIVSYVRDAVTEKDYLTLSNIDENSYTATSNCFYIERIVGDTNGTWKVQDGTIKIGDFIRLRAYDKEITIPYEHISNPSNTMDFKIIPWTYPSKPDWDETSWPFTESYPPVYPNADGTIRGWKPSDGLPEGSVTFYGKVGLQKNIQPLLFEENGTWYNIDGYLWTSVLDSSTILELDEYVNYDDKKLITNFVTPDFSIAANEYYFAYNTEKENTLQVSLTKRKENNDFLLYLPKRNEQKFVNKITNLHQLSDTDMGIFTENELWYIRSVIGTDGVISYTKPILSKIPFGCRYGDDVITLFDGQGVIFATPYGVAVLSPQDFVATTEKSLSYLSDAIREKYYNFYHNSVDFASIPNEIERVYKPMIKIKPYRYWILFYKFMDREILVLDTRNNSWWSWTVPYPIRSLEVNPALVAILNVEYSPIVNIHTDKWNVAVHPLGYYAPRMGIPFLFSDDKLASTEIDYCDDTIENTINGITELVYENEFIGNRIKLQYASPNIDWHFTSQKLHFGQINNYKTIKGINVNIKGEDKFTAKISTKAFRDVYHPEHTSVIEIKVDDIRTFVKRLNLMHVVDFQYTFENDIGAEPSQLRLNALSIKYEIKEGIR